MDQPIKFKFLYIDDKGDTDGGRNPAKCPHCGADGRYIYHWEEDGVRRAAMQGCYKMLTGSIRKDDYSKFMELLSEKQAKRKPLNGWDKTVVRMLQFIEQGKYTKEWCEKNIIDAISQRNRYIANKY